MKPKTVYVVKLLLKDFFLLLPYLRHFHLVSHFSASVTLRCNFVAKCQLSHKPRLGSELREDASHREATYTFFHSSISARFLEAEASSCSRVYTTEGSYFTSSFWSQQFRPWIWMVLYGCNKRQNIFLLVLSMFLPEYIRQLLTFMSTYCQSTCRCDVLTRHGGVAPGIWDKKFVDLNILHGASIYLHGGTNGIRLWYERQHCCQFRDQNILSQLDLMDELCVPYDSSLVVWYPPSFKGVFGPCRHD